MRLMKYWVVLFCIQLLSFSYSFAGSIIVHENGNVGIGTVNPGKKLHVVGGDARFENTNNIYFDINSVNGGSSNVYYRLLSAGDAKAALAYDAYDGITLGRIITGNIQRDIFIRQSNGNIGIGTNNPSDKLHINGFVRLNNGYGIHSDGGNIVFGGGDKNLNTEGIYFSSADFSQNNMFISGSGNVGIGNMAPSYKLDVNGAIRGSNVSPSDARWKTSIRTIEGPLEKVAQLRGVTYEWADPSKGIGEQIGVIAQEVEQVFPQAVSTDNEGYKSVAYARLVGPLIEAVKELKKENEMLKKRIEALENE